MGLSWLSPVFLLGTAAALVPVALHLFLRHRAPLVDFAAMRYLKSAPIERQSRRRLKEWLLLAMRVAALVLLALAFARPYLMQGAAAAGGRVTVIMLDNSASLTGPGQFERARALAVEALAGVPAGEAVGVLTFGGPADVVAPVSTDHRVANAALQAANPGAGSTRYADAIARGADLLDGRPGRVIVVTDLQSSGWDVSGASGVPDTVDVDVRVVPGPSTNASIDSLRRDGNQAVAVVHNYSATMATHLVTFAKDRAPLGRTSVVVPPLGTAEARVPLDTDASGTLSATVEDGAGYLADNARYAVIGAARPKRVAIVTASGDSSECIYVLRALEAAEGVTRPEVRLLSALQFSTMPATGNDDADVLMILATRGLDQRGRERVASFVRRGGGLLVGVGPEVDLSFIADALGTLVKTSAKERVRQSPLAFSPQDMRHPIFKPLGEFGTLAHVEFRQTVTLVVSDAADVLARFSDGSAALVDERAGDAGNVLLFASDLNNAWNTLPLQPAFAPFLSETAAYLAARSEGRSEYFAGELPQKGGDVPGILRLDGTASRTVAVNIDPRESNPARISPEAFGLAVTPLKAQAALRDAADARGSEDTQRLWQYGLGMMLVLLAAEGALGRGMG